MIEIRNDVSSQIRMKTTGYNSAKSWGIAVACSFVNCLVTFPGKISSILFVEFVEHYTTDRQKASLFVLISGLLRCLIGPVVGYLVEILELRYLTLIGCCIASIGVGACYFAKDIVAVTIFLGLIYGTGFALANSLIVQIIKPHFNKNIANANGILHGGTCIGAFSTIPIFSVLLNRYDVSGALLILSGLMLHGIPIAMLLKDPKYTSDSPLSMTKLSEKGNDQRDALDTPQGYKNCNTASSEKENIPSTQVTLHHIEINKFSTRDKNILTNIHPQEVQETVDCQAQPLGSVSFQLLSSCKLEESNESKSIYGFNNDLKQVTLLQKTSTFQNKSKLWTYFEVLLVFKDMSFIVILICESIHLYAEVFILTTIIDISREKGISRSQEQFFPMFFIFSETAGYLGLGCVTDKGYLSVTNYAGFCFLCMGASCFCLVLTKNFLTTILVTMAFGLCSSGISIAKPLLVYEFVEESKQNMAIASSLVLYAPLSLTMAPMISYFKDTFGSYNGALYLQSTVCTGSALLVSLLPCIVRCRNRKK